MNDRVTFLLVGFVLGMAFLLGVALVATSGGEPGMHDARVFCPNIQEDSAAHLRLVQYEHEGSTLLYQCERSGY